MKISYLLKRPLYLLNRELLISILGQIILLGNSLLLPFFYNVSEIGNYGFWLSVITPLAGVISLKLDYQLLKSKKVLLEGIGLLFCILLCVCGLSILFDIIFYGEIFSFISGALLASILPILYSVLIIIKKRIYIYYNQILTGILFFIFIFINQKITLLGIQYNYIFSRYLSLLIQFIVLFYLAKEIFKGSLKKYIIRIYFEMRSKDAISLVTLDLLVLTLQNAPMYLFKIFSLDALLATYYYSFRLVKSPNMLLSSYITNLVKSGNKKIINRLNIINGAMVFFGTISFVLFYIVVIYFTDTKLYISYVVIMYTVIYVILETNYEFKKYLYFVGDRVKSVLKHMGTGYIVMLIFLSVIYYLFGVYQDSYHLYLFLLLFPYLFASFKYRQN